MPNSPHYFEAPNREYYHCPNVDANGGYGDSTHATLVDDPAKANLISSRIANQGGVPLLHAPVIDFDFPIEIYPSSQLGHSHLYINKKISWYGYKKILNALYGSGLIQPGFYSSALDKEMTAVRPVGVVKLVSPKGLNYLKENALLRKENYELRRKLAELEAKDEQTGTASS